MSTFAARVTEILDKKGLKRADLIRALDVSESTVRAWFNRDVIPAVDIAYKVAKYLDVSLEFLVTGKDGPRSSDKSEIEVKFEMLSELEQKEILNTIDFKLKSKIAMRANDFLRA